MRIGNLQLDNNIFLAPMAGVTDLPYRILAKEMGVGFVCTELISAKGIYYKNKNTLDMLKIDKKEGCAAIQIFGSDPEIIGEVAKEIDNYNFHVLDLNVGCPAPKIVRNGEGSALMKTPKVIGEIIKKMVDNSSKPVTAKIRKGYDLDNVNAVEVAKIIEANGASMIAVHGRTRSQYYSGKADWDIIKEVKKAVKIPVVGNGDIVDAISAKNMIEHTGCDGVMIGRGAAGNPFIFREVTHYLHKGVFLAPPTDDERIEVALRHAKMLIEYKGEYLGVREMRRHIVGYTKNMPHSSKVRHSINEAQTFEDIKNILSFKNF